LCDLPHPHFQTTSRERTASRRPRLRARWISRTRCGDGRRIPGSSPPPACRRRWGSAPYGGLQRGLRGAAALSAGERSGVARRRFRQEHRLQVQHVGSMITVVRLDGARTRGELLVWSPTELPVLRNTWSEKMSPESVQRVEAVRSTRGRNAKRGLLIGAALGAIQRGRADQVQSRHVDVRNGRGLGRDWSRSRSAERRSFGGGRLPALIGLLRVKVVDGGWSRERLDRGPCRGACRR
jgi:hypothetical protein